MSNSEALRGFIPQDAKPQTTQSVNPLADQVHASAFLGEGLQAYEQHLEAATLPERRSVPSSQDRNDGQDKTPRGGKGKIVAAIAAGVGALGVAGTLFFGADNQNKPKVSDSTPTKIPEPATETVAVLPTEDTFPTFTTVPFTPTPVGGIDASPTDPEQTNVAEVTPVETQIKIEETQTKPPETTGLHYEVEGAEWFGGFTVEGFETILPSGEVVPVGFREAEGPSDLLDQLSRMVFMQYNGELPKDAQGQVDMDAVRAFVEANNGYFPDFQQLVIDDIATNETQPKTRPMRVPLDLSKGMDLIRSNDSIDITDPVTGEKVTVKMNMSDSNSNSALYVHPTTGRLTFQRSSDGKPFSYEVRNAHTATLARHIEATGLANNGDRERIKTASKAFTKSFTNLSATSVIDRRAFYQDPSGEMFDAIPTNR